MPYTFFFVDEILVCVCMHVVDLITQWYTDATKFERLVCPNQGLDIFSGSLVFDLLRGVAGLVFPDKVVTGFGFPGVVAGVTLRDRGFGAPFGLSFRVDDTGGAIIRFSLQSPFSDA